VDIPKLLASMNSGYIVTVAGVGYRDHIPANKADICWPMGVVRSADGDLIIADIRGHRIWRIDNNGILRTVAGDSVPEDSGDGGPAIDARVFTPHDLCLDKEGNIYFSQLGIRGPNQGPNVVRKINRKTGIISRVAGSGRVGSSGDGGPALEADFDGAVGVAVDDLGNLYICCMLDHNIRRVEATTGIIETFAGQTARGNSDENKDFGHDNNGYNLGGFFGDGGLASAAVFQGPEHLAFDSHGDLYICDNKNNRVRKIDITTGIITTVFGTGQPASNGDGGPAVNAATLYPDAIRIDIHDNIYVSEAHGYRLRKIDSQTRLVTTLVGTGLPGYGADGLPGHETTCSALESGIWADPDGTVFFSECTGRLRRYDGQTGVVTTVLGGSDIRDGSPASEAFLGCPNGISIGVNGHIYFADMLADRVRVIDPSTGVISTVAGSGGRSYGGDNGPALDAHFMWPGDVSVDSRERIVIADTLNGRVRRVDEKGIVQSIAGTGQGFDSGDEGPAISASFVSVLSVAHGADDDIYVGDSVGRIRKINSHTGIISTVAGTGVHGYAGDGGLAVQARIGAPSAICFDRQGNLYFCDRDYHVVRKVDGDGVISTLAGSGESGFSPDGTIALESQLNKPYGLAVTADGTVYVSDSLNNRVRRFTLNGLLETVAGCANAGDSGNEGPAIKASLNEPHGLCLYDSDVLLIADHFSNCIKAVKLN